MEKVSLHLTVVVEGEEWVKDHLEYAFRVSGEHGRSLPTTCVQRRFREVHHFDQQLRDNCPVEVIPALPRLPVRLPFRRLCRRLPVLVAKRRVAVQGYFDSLLSLRRLDITLRICEFFEVSVPSEISIAAGRAARVNTTSVIGPKAITERPLEADIAVKSHVVGEGGGGRVYLAERKKTGAQCVVKSFRKQDLSKRALVALQTEVEVHSSLDHPLIAKLEDVYETPTSVHLVLEHLNGGELFDRISERGPLGEEEAAGLITQLLNATAYLHSHGVIHGDIKPENAVFDRKWGCDDVLKLIDFGLSRRWDQKNPISGMRGTLSYIAPEVLVKPCTDKVDLWSIGIISYTMLCGCSPWRGSDARVRRDIIAGEPYFHPPRWEPLTSEAKDFITQLLQKDPCRRPSAAEALGHPWLQSHCISAAAPEHPRANTPLKSTAWEKWVASCMHSQASGSTCSLRSTRSHSENSLFSVGFP
jgi:tRNA A-37 threonylcarbamoyl transferase component Bud32